MSHLPFTITAYLLNSISVTVDKFLLSKTIPDPLVYVFYFSCYSLVVLLVIPFTHFPSTEAFLLSSCSTLLWTLGAYLMFKALQIGQVSRVIPIIGTLIPLFLLTEAVINQTLILDQVWAIGFLILGIIFLTIQDWKGKFSKQEIWLEIFSSLLFALSYLLLRHAYLIQDFLTVFVYSRLILIPIGALILLIPMLRKKVFSRQEVKIHFKSKTGVLFLIGQAAGGGAELLLTFSVSLATPALVNSLQGVQYVFLFIFSLILSHKFPGVYQERISHQAVWTKVGGILLIGIGLYILSLADAKPPKPDLGVTFSPRYAQKLGLDPKQTFDQMLTDLPVKFIRFPLYWDEVEKNPGTFDLFQTNYYLEQAQKKDLKIIPVVGMKVPRWPECFIPQFYQDLPTKQRQAQTLELLKAEVTQLKDSSTIEAWQVENEPFLSYGICPKPDPNFLQQEVALVRLLDPKRPILITDSGELSIWVPALRAGDWFGMTMYRTVWDKFLGFFDYPFPAFFYHLKYNLARIFAPQNEMAMVIELQAEPWAPNDLNVYELPLNTQLQLFPAQKVSSNFSFAQRSSFNRVYFWGVEWWYYMKIHEQPQYLDAASQIFKAN